MRASKSSGDPRDPRAASAKDHGSHTLRAWEGVVVGIDRDDVFVELGPRMQGVISAREFGREAPVIGATYEFTLRGQEESLWALALERAAPLHTWEEMEVGLWVPVKLVRVKEGGLEGKIGALHAFLPRSHTGLPRDKPTGLLIGKSLTCEVVQVDRERQRVTVSRKEVLKKERLGRRQREVGGLAPGEVVDGRVTRVEGYGAFVRFGHGLEGLVHVSDLAWRHVDHPDEVVQRGDRVQVKVLRIRREGRRISLGLKQMTESPFVAFEASHDPGDVVLGTVRRLVKFGAFVEVAPGVEGLLHRSETPFAPHEPLARHLRVGLSLSLRVVSVDAELARLGLSLLHTDGSRIAPEEAAGSMAADVAGRGESRPSGASLGRLLERAGLGSPEEPIPPAAEAEPDSAEDAGAS